MLQRRDYFRIMEKKMELLHHSRVYIGGYLGMMERWKLLYDSRVYIGGCIGIMEKNMQTTIL